jgi:hypothetical protein
VENADPIRNIDFSESELPKCRKSSTERLLPMRNCPYTDKELPVLVKFRIESAEPIEE